MYISYNVTFYYLFYLSFLLHFVQYIQEFICCSELSSQPIKSSDLLPELGELCYDPIIFTLHPQNMEASSISVIASDTQSLLDIYNHDSGFVSTTIRVYDDNLTNTTTENSVSKTKVRNDANLIEEHRGVVAMRCVHLLSKLV
jgi:hypothetical protein